MFNWLACVLFLDGHTYTHIPVCFTHPPVCCSWTATHTYTHTSTCFTCLPACVFWTVTYTTCFSCLPVCCSWTHTHTHTHPCTQHVSSDCLHSVLGMPHISTCFTSPPMCCSWIATYTHRHVSLACLHAFLGLTCTHTHVTLFSLAHHTHINMFHMHACMLFLDCHTHTHTQHPSPPQHVSHTHTPQYVSQNKVFLKTKNAFLLNYVCSKPNVFTVFSVVPMHAYNMFSLTISVGNCPMNLGISVQWMCWLSVASSDSPSPQWTTINALSQMAGSGWRWRCCRQKHENKFEWSTTKCVVRACMPVLLCSLLPSLPPPPS